MTRQHTSHLAAACTAVALLWWATAAAATTVGGTHFSPRIDVGEADLTLRGAAVLHYKRIFKAYAAALYLQPDSPSQAVLADEPKRLEIEYFWGISADDFRKATIEGIARNLPADKVDELEPAIRSFNAFYSDVEPGDRYALTYLPGKGTELSLNGEPRGTVAGLDFAAAMFSIWLGDSPLDRALKAALLGS